MTRTPNGYSFNLLGITILMESSLTPSPQLRLVTSRQRKKRNSYSSWTLNSDPVFNASPSTFITIARHKRITRNPTNLRTYMGPYTFNLSQQVWLRCGPSIPKAIESLSNRLRLDPQPCPMSLLSPEMTSSITLSTIALEVRRLAASQSAQRKLQKRL